MLKELLKQDFVFFDGAIGSLLQKNGLKVGQRPDVMNMTAPAVVESIQRQYIEAGSDIIITNTFGANARALKGTGYSVEDVITAAVGITKKAGSGKTLTALDMGPIGEFISPFGNLTFDQAYALYREQAVAAEAAGADLVAVETMNDLMEVKAAILAVKENTKLPVFVTMTFDKNGRTLTGCRPESFAINAEGLGAAAIGINCSLAPQDIFPIAEKIAKSSQLPMIIKPNAGLPSGITGEYDITPVEFAQQMAPFASLGVKIIGGCCGTTPEYIKELKKTYSTLKPALIARDQSRRICTPYRIESVEGLEPAYISGCPARDVDNIADDALDQADGGAEILTVRFPDGITPDEAADIVRDIQSQSDRPLNLVSDDMETLASALRALTGTAAVSTCTVQCTERDQREFTEIATKYGAVMI